MKACCWLKLRNLGKWSLSMASFTEMNPMYATIQESPPASHSPLPSVASKWATATSQTALLNPYDRPEREEAAETSAYPSGSKRLDAESTIYGKAPPEEKQKKVANLDSVDYHSRDCPWTGIQSCTFLVLPVLACVFAAAVLILTLLIAFGVLQGEQTAAEQVGGALNRLYRSFSCEWRAVTRRHPSPALFVAHAVCERVCFTQNCPSLPCWEYGTRHAA